MYISDTAHPMLLSFFFSRVAHRYHQHHAIYHIILVSVQPTVLRFLAALCDHLSFSFTEKKHVTIVRQSLTHSRRMSERRKRKGETKSQLSVTYILQCDMKLVPTILVASVSFRTCTGAAELD